MKSRKSPPSAEMTPSNDTLQKGFEEGLSKIVDVFFQNLLAQKLEDKGIKLPAKTLLRFSEHIRSGNKEPFTLPSRNMQRSIELDFTDQDLETISRRVDEFHEKHLSSLTSKLTVSSSKAILKRLKDGWNEEGALQAKDLAGFRERMELRWGIPLGQLRMLLTMVREWSQTTSGRHGATSSKRNDLTGILIRLLVRGCQITDEIICLLENGFADGAMARWRTLHEITVVAAILRQYGDEIADRYLDHQYVESKRAMDKYEETAVLLGYRALSKHSKDHIQSCYAKVISKYGDNFKSDYGWAAFHLKNKRPSFAVLEKAAGRSDMRSYYQMGNDNIHAGIKSMYVRLGLIGNYDALLAGRSNVGLTDPGQNTAHSLTQLAVIVCLATPIMDDLVVGNMIQSLRSEIPRSFSRIDNEIKREEREKRAKTKGRTLTKASMRKSTSS